MILKFAYLESNETSFEYISNYLKNNITTVNEKIIAEVNLNVIL